MPLCDFRVILIEGVRVEDMLQGLADAAADFADILVLARQDGIVDFVQAVHALDDGFHCFLIGIFHLQPDGSKVVELLRFGVDGFACLCALSARLGIRHHRLFELRQQAVEAFLAIAAAFLVVQQHGFRQLLADAHDGVQGAQRVLEHHGQLVAAQGVELFFRNLQQILAVVDDFARIHHGVARQNAHDSTGGDGLAGTGFTGDGERFAFLQIEGNIAHCANRTVVCAEGDGQVSDFQLCHISRPLLSTKDSARRAGHYQTG